jgi:hypothetical protein
MKIVVVARNDRYSVTKHWFGKEQAVQQPSCMFRFAGLAGATAILLVWIAAAGNVSFAEESAAEEVESDGSESSADEAPAPAAAKLPEPEGAKRLSPKYEIWLDPKAHCVLVDGQVSLREGMLEMFACTRNTKEHESIVSVNTQAYLVHAALLSLGAEPGRPVQFVPAYKPPAGTRIDVDVRWIDEQGKEQTARAQDWVKDIGTGKAMAHPFVFAGSSFWTDPENGKQHYRAEYGDFICVSNFSTAMLDIPVESPQADFELEFEAFTERIPPLGTPVRLVLKPEKKGEGGGRKGEGKPDPERTGSQ